MEMKVDRQNLTNREDMKDCLKDCLKDIREPNCVSNYIFHDQDSRCSLIKYAAGFHFTQTHMRSIVYQPQRVISMTWKLLIDNLRLP